MPEKSDQLQAKPFLKWAGGKRQLLAQLETCFPPQLHNEEISHYAEPFVGSGALFFKVFQSYPIGECLLADVNPELILVYKTIQQDVNNLIDGLGDIEMHYLDLDPDHRQDFYYQIRDQYNQQRETIRFRNYEPG